jgi:glycosyltransferase involved in cell wall biosynthesis
MRIAQVAPLYESVPPCGYGGTERVVSWLTEELVRRGHEVTVFASGDSQTGAHLIPGCRVSLRTNPHCRDPLAHHVVMLEQVRKLSSKFDIIHFHTDYLHFSMTRQCGSAHVTTLHGRLDLPDLVPLFAEFRDVPVISISRAQRRPLPGANWIGNVYHGIPEKALLFNARGGDYLAFIGRLSPEKRPDRAIRIAEGAGMRLRIAAKVDNADREYFETRIKSLLAKPHVEYIGEIPESHKSEFLGNALATLAPIDWPEPFGLNMIESMACGTPVIAFRGGSVPELIEDGVTGYIVDNVDEAIEAVKRVPELSRESCRHAFETRFTAQRMAADYLKIYDQQLHTSPGYSQAVALPEPEVNIALVPEELS